jgi:hypothetical protein
MLAAAFARVKENEDGARFAPGRAALSCRNPLDSDRAQSPKLGRPVGGRRLRAVAQEGVRCSHPAAYCIPMGRGPSFAPEPRSSSGRDQCGASLLKRPWSVFGSTKQYHRPRLPDPPLLLPGSRGRSASVPQARKDRPPDRTATVPIAGPARRGRGAARAPERAHLKVRKEEHRRQRVSRS